MPHANRAITDHGLLTGLSDDDHTQYHNDTRGDARYYTQDQVLSFNGGNMILNGSGFLGNNTNFSSLTFDPLVANGNPGSFRRNGDYLLVRTDSFFPIMPGQAYRISVDIKVTSNNTKTQYVGFDFSDVDDKTITAVMHMFDNGTLAQTTRDFQPGVDTHIYIDDDTGWSFGTSTAQRGIILWNYSNDAGFLYPPHTYSRNYLIGITPASAAVTDIGGGEFEIDTNTTGYTTGGNNDDLIPSGTYVSRMNTGGSFKYVAASNVSVPTDDEWHTYSGYIGGIDTTGTNKTNSFSPGAAKAEILMLTNFNGTAADDVKVWFANIDVRPVTEVNLVADGSYVTTGHLGTITYNRGFRPTATSSGVTSEIVIP